MKRYAAALAALCLLSGCAEEAAPIAETAPIPPAAPYHASVTVEKTALAQEAALEMMRQFALEHKVSFPFTAENFPRAAVSVSTAPLLHTAADTLLNGSAPSAEAAVCPASADAFRALLNGSADLILAEEPPASLWDEKDAAGFSWEMDAVAADALVFAVSADNPIESLSVSDLRGLYAGTITNWAELGGPDLPVLPLRGGAGSDAETAMENLVMDGVPIAENPALVRENGDELLSGAARSGAVAPAGYYRASALFHADAGWKLLSVGGAAPSTEAIRSGTYPLLNRCYVLISAAAPQDSPERALRDWLVSREGQEAASRAGCVPMMELGGVS